jgi:hypothetical protein
MRYLVCDYTGQFVLVPRGLDKPGVHADIAAGQRERVDSWIFDDKECEVVIALVGLCHYTTADLVDVLGNQWVFDDFSAAADIPHDHAANLGFLAVVQDGIGRAAHIGKIDVIGPSAADENQRSNGKRNKRTFGRAWDHGK